MGFSLGGSYSSNRSSNEAASNANADQRVFGQQAGALGDMYGQAGDTFQQTQGPANQINNMAGGLSNQLGGYANQAAGGYGNQLAGGSMGDTSDVRGLLMDSFRRQQGGSNMGDMYGSIVGGQGNTYIDPMVAAMKQGGMENLSRMQANTGLDASAMGQSGSSRHAMQNAMQAGDMNKQMLDREVQMRGGAYDQDMDMKMRIAQQADTNALANQGNLMQAMGMSDSNTQQGMQNAGGMQELGMGQMAPWMQAQSAPWQNMQSYAGVLGGPTVLDSANSSATSSGRSKGRSMSLSGSMGV